MKLRVEVLSEGGQKRPLWEPLFADDSVGTTIAEEVVQKLLSNNKKFGKMES